MQFKEIIKKLPRSRMWWTEYAASCGSQTCPCDQLRTSGWEVMLGHWVARCNHFSSVQSLSHI